MYMSGKIFNPEMGGCWSPKICGPWLALAGLGSLALEALLGMSQLCSATVHLLYCRWGGGGGFFFLNSCEGGSLNFFVMKGVGQDILFSYLKNVIEFCQPTPGHK
jgi:hypothetical protein